MYKWDQQRMNENKQYLKYTNENEQYCNIHSFDHFDDI